MNWLKGEVTELEYDPTRMFTTLTASILYKQQKELMSEDADQNAANITEDGFFTGLNAMRVNVEGSMI